MDELKKILRAAVLSSFVLALCGLTREAQHSMTFASPSVAYLLVYLWGRCPQTPGIYRFAPET